MLRETEAGFARFNNGTELIHRYLPRTAAVYARTQLHRVDAFAVMTRVYHPTCGIAE